MLCETILDMQQWIQWICPQRICSSVYKEDKKNKHLNKWNDFLKKLDFHEHVTAKGYEEHSGNCPGSGIIHRQAFIFWEVLIPIQKKYCSR